LKRPKTKEECKFFDKGFTTNFCKKGLGMGVCKGLCEFAKLPKKEKK